MKKLLLLLFPFSFLLSPAFSQGAWSPRTSFPDTGYSQGISGFSIGNYGYVGLGNSTGAARAFNFFWQFNASTNVWTRKAPFPGRARISPASFVIGGKAYIVTGSVSNGGACVTECWEYDTTTDTWTQKANFPGPARTYALGFAIDSLGYVGTGANELRDFHKDFYAYHPSTNTWTRVADFGGIARYCANGFGVNGKGYVCFGMDSTLTAYNDTWEYDPVSNTWTQKNSCPGPGFAFGIGFAICDNIYVGSGDTTDALLTDDHGRFWKYNTVSNIWSEETITPYPPRILGAAFAIGDTGYYGLGNDSTGLTHTIFDKFNAPDSCNGYTGYNPLIDVLEVNIYPNPFNTECFINLSNQYYDVPEFILFNIVGVKQKIDIKGANSNYILLRDRLKEGVYILSVEYNNRIYYKKLVITD